MQKYLRRRKEQKRDLTNLTADELIAMTFKHCNNKKVLVSILSLFIVLPILLGGIVIKNIHSSGQDLEDADLVSLASAPITATAAKKNLISIPTGTVKANPFLPYRDINKGSSVSDVPTYDLVAPPEVINKNSDAARVMDTIVSGILYDKFSPSAILNIEGNDYLVKKGDVVNKYKVLNITQNSVTVKLGNNTYNAGIGEILTEGSVNYNGVSNLSKKFGGERRWDIIICKDYCQQRYY